MTVLPSSDTPREANSSPDGGNLSIKVASAACHNSAKPLARPISTKAPLLEATTFSTASSPDVLKLKSGVGEPAFQRLTWPFGAAKVYPPPSGQRAIVARSADVSEKVRIGALSPRRQIFIVLSAPISTNVAPL